VINFVLFACGLNFVEVARITYVVEQAWYTVAVLLHLPLSSDENKEKNEMGVACGKHWREEKYI